VIRILPCLAILLAAGAEPGVVLFRSGFEQGVVLDPPFVRGGQQWQTISGTDETTGSSWSELPGRILGFQPLIAPESDAALHVQDRIVTALGRNGDSTRVLLQTVLSDDPAYPGRSRSNYLFTPDARMVDAVQSSWIFLQPDLLEVMAPAGVSYNWRQLWEVKCGPREDGVPSFRLNVAIAYTRERGLHWRAEGEHGPFDGTGEREFRFVDDRIEVPAGRWFELEIRLKQHPTDGRFTCRIDGETLCDWSGKTMNESLVEKWTLVKLYTAPERMGGPHWQYVDDIELRGTE
jgi:hypothetical protein